MPSLLTSAAADSNNVCIAARFSAKTATDLYEYAVSGRSMVRFDKHARVSLYDVSCSTYNYSNYITFDFGC
jgi:hypothetical protein